MGGNLLCSVLPNIFGCTPKLTTYDGQVGLRPNKGLKRSNSTRIHTGPIPLSIIRLRVPEANNHLSRPGTILRINAFRALIFLLKLLL